MRILLFTLLLAASTAHAAPRPKLVVAILVDQLRADYLERFHGDFTENGFKLFTDRGAYMTRAQYNYAPTVTGPGHASFFSGSTPMMHGIISNDWYDKRTGKLMYCCGDSTVTGVGTASPAGQMSPRNFIGGNFSDEMRLHFRSKVVGISMKDRGAILPAGKKPAGAFWFESATGNFISSSYYFTELPGWVQQFNQKQRAHSFIGQTWDRLVDPSHYAYPDAAAGEGKLEGEKASTFPHKIEPSKKEGLETIMPTPFGNQILMEFAKAAVEGEKLGQGAQPDVLTVSFSSIDYCGHRFGPYSQEVQDITLRLDRQLAEFFTYLDKTLGLANVVTVITADHAVAPTPEFAREQGLDGKRLDTIPVMGELLGKLNERFGPAKYLLSPRLFDGHLYFNHEALREKQVGADALAEFIREWALATGDFQAVYSRSQLLDGRAPGPIGQRLINGFHAERSGDVVLVPKPYTIHGGSSSGTTHGSPYTYDTHVPVGFFGAPFKPGRYADEFNITDIVPTLAAALHVSDPPASMGKALVRALAEP
jgi:predicted AlkP superfamily pyrophosphatase or phosphodiesterase